MKVSSLMLNLKMEKPIVSVIVLLFLNLIKFLILDFSVCVQNGTQ